MRSKECDAVSVRVQGMREKLYPHKTPFFERGGVREGYGAERRPAIF